MSDRTHKTARYEVNVREVVKFYAQGFLPRPQAEALAAILVPAVLAEFRSELRKAERIRNRRKP